MVEGGEQGGRFSQQVEWLTGGQSRSDGAQKVGLFRLEWLQPATGANAVGTRPRRRRPTAPPVPVMSSHDAPHYGSHETVALAGADPLGT